VNQKVLLSFAVAFAGVVSVAKADLTGATYWNTTYADLYNCVMTTNVSGYNATLTLDTQQTGTSGLMRGTFTANSVEDPRATKIYYIDNNTGFSWQGYEVTVSMDRAFSISNAAVSLPASWAVYSVTQPTLNVSGALFPGTQYDGQVVYWYNGGSVLPSGPGNELDFQYDVGFSGSTVYNFADHLRPLEAIPEPAALGFGLLGALTFGFRRFARK
jgi:hypothetical protein